MSELVFTKLSELEPQRVHEPMQIIHQEKWLRFILENGAYSVQVKHWFRWKNVTFGPYRPHKVGIHSFKIRHIAEFHFIMCLAKGKAYTLQGI